MKWFKHDTDASTDAKLQAILLDYGAAGYGLYWYCVEMIAGNVTARNISFELEHDARVIAKNLGMSVQQVQEMMQKMADLGLFDISQNSKLRCIKLAYRLDDHTRKFTQMDEIIEKFSAVRINSGQTPDKLRESPSRREEKRREEKEKRTEETFALSAPAIETPSKSKNGTRLPIAELPAEWGDVALGLRDAWSNADVLAEFDVFRDYWIAQPGQKGAKLDWLATWRNWCRRSRREGECQ